MITIEKHLDWPDTYPLSRLGALDSLLFFDIETTGFSGDTSCLYLIGCAFHREDGWRLVQWFADRPGAEVELLDAFFGLLKDFRVLVHFNGDSFDIPFLLKRCRHLGLPYDFSGIESVDIYKRIRPYRKLLGLESMKQKAIEQFLHISRTDIYSGGQLIEVYGDYLVTHETRLLDMLLLHNEDDLKGMGLILPILNYPDFFEHEFRLLATEEAPGPALTLTCESDFSVPVPFQCDCEIVRCEGEGRRLTFTVRLYEGTLKHFYSNYRDYYYLIYEDTAVHKSVGEYVAREARVRATASNCYTKKSGLFLPQFDGIWEPVMKEIPGDKFTYVPLESARLDEPDSFRQYVKQLFGYLGVH